MYIFPGRRDSSVMFRSAWVIMFVKLFERANDSGKALYKCTHFYNYFYYCCWEVTYFKDSGKFRREQTFRGDQHPFSSVGHMADVMSYDPQERRWNLERASYYYLFRKLIPGAHSLNLPWRIGNPNSALRSPKKAKVRFFFIFLFF